MSPSSRPGQPDDGELLSAYLRDDLSAAESAALEARLASEPRLGERLDRLHASLERLRRLDEPEPPAGFSARMRSAAAAAWEAAPPGPAAGSEGAAALEPASPPATAAHDLGARVLNFDRRRVQRRWFALSSAAAGVVLVAVAGLSLVRFPSGDDSADSADLGARTTAQAPAAEAEGDGAGAAVPEAEAEDAGGAAPGEGAGDTAGGPAGADADEEILALEEGAAPAPVVLDERVTLDGDAAVVERAGEAGEAADVLGLPREEAAGAAAAAGEALRRDPVAAAIGAAACAHAVGSTSDSPAVITRAESVRWEGTDAVLYVTVSATPGSPTLDQTEAWVVDAGSCNARRPVSLP